MIHPETELQGKVVMVLDRTGLSLIHYQMSLVDVMVFALCYIISRDIFSHGHFLGCCLPGPPGPPGPAGRPGKPGTLHVNVGIL